MRRAALLVLLLLVVACASSRMAVETLYFGTNAGDARVVGDAEWERFLDEVVSPRFPGFTDWPARGHWKGEDEATYVLAIAHDGTPEHERAIAEIIAEYKRRFRQEAVMRVRERVRVTFE